jgi:hypothetical protein
MHGGCRQAPPQQKSAQQAQATPQKSLEPIDAGGGVYYFPLVGNDYRAALGKFLLEHPELKCRYFGADDALDTAGFGAPTAYAHIVGHTVVCTPIGKYAQDDTRE